MDWWLIGTLGIVIVTLIAIYRRSVRESRALTYLALALTLDDDVREAQQVNLRKYVTSVDAKNAPDLSLKVFLLTSQIAERMVDNAAPTVAARLWKLKIGTLKLKP
jgi:hypothetical protein